MKPKRIILVIDDGYAADLPLVLKVWGYVAVLSTSKNWREVLRRNPADMALTTSSGVYAELGQLPAIYVEPRRGLGYYFALREQLRLPLVRKRGPKGPRKAVGCQMAEERKAAS